MQSKRSDVIYLRKPHDGAEPVPFNVKAVAVIADYKARRWVECDPPESESAQKSKGK